MRARRTLTVLLAALLLGGGLQRALAEPTAVGDVAAVRVSAYGTPPGQPRRDLHLRYEVYAQELLETVPGGALHVRLRDDTVLRLGSETSVVLDRFVYDAEAGAGSLLARVARGVCRFVTGRVFGDFVVVTRAATMVPRGTEFSVWVTGGTTLVWVQQGIVEVIPTDGSPSRVVERGGIVTVNEEGGGVREAPRPAPDPGINPTPHLRLKPGKNVNSRGP